MTFALPQFLWLLLLVPLAGWLLWWAARCRQRLLDRFVGARLRESLTAGFSPARRRFRAICLLAALALLVVAVARPQWGFQWEEVKQRGLDIIVAIDTSRSMLAEDIKPNRLERAKLAAMDLAQQARSDRVGLIAFAGTAFLQCPLTLDDEAFRQSVTLLDTEIIPQGGTAIAEAIEVARGAFTNSGENFKILVVFTDGEDHEAGVMEAAQAAAKDGLKIFCVGLGMPEGENVRVPAAGGRRETIKNEQGEEVRSRLNERLLDNLARAAGGFYVHLRGAHTVQSLYEKGLAPLPKAEFGARLMKQYHERYHWPLGLAILLLVVEILVPDRMLRKINGPGRLAALLVAALMVAALPGGAVSPGEARKQLDTGYNKAAKQAYEQLLQKRPEDPRLHYNLGVAAFRDKDYERAAREFDAATLAPDNLPLQQQAFYNQGNAMFRLGEAESDPQKKMKSWQSATNQYATALRMNPQDADAKHNLDLVTKMLQELEQQHQQSQDQSDQKDQNDQKDQKDQKDQQNQQPSPQDQQQKQQAEDQQKQQPPPKESQSKPEQQQQQQQGKAGDQKDQQGQENDQKAAAQAAGAVLMTPDQARQLLEAAKVEEKVLPFVPPENPDRKKAPNRTHKDW